MGQPWALISQLCPTSFTNSHSLVPPACQWPYLPQADLFPSVQFTQSAFSMDILSSLWPSRARLPFSFVHGACIPGIMSLLSYLQLHAYVLLVPWPWSSSPQDCLHLGNLRCWVVQVVEIKPVEASLFQSISWAALPCPAQDTQVLKPFGRTSTGGKECLYCLVPTHMLVYLHTHRHTY